MRAASDLPSSQGVRVLVVRTRLSDTTYRRDLDGRRRQVPSARSVVTYRGRRDKCATEGMTPDQARQRCELGVVERSHRIDQEEFYRMLKGVVIDDTELFNDRLQEWEDFYNFSRPHGGLGGETPYERLREKTTSPV
jgi:transposase InsO family protein